MRRRSQPVRVRLTLWYALLLAAVLALYLGAVAALLFQQMRGVVERLAIEDVETVEGLLYVAPGGGVGVREDYHTHAQWRQVEERFLEVLAPDGSVLFRNDRLAGRGLGGPPFAGEGVSGYSARSARLSDGTEVVAVSRRHELDGRPLLIRLAYPLALVWGQWRETISILLLALPLAMAAIALAGYRMAGLAFDPIAEITQRAAEINSQRLHDRLPAGNADDELGQLATVINAMLTRIEQSFEQLRRFTSDASHELRAPLAALRSVGEVRLQREASAAEYRDTIGSMLEELGRLNELVDGLLTLSRADAGHLPFTFADCSALALAREVTGLLEVLAEDKGLRVTCEGDGGALIRCDRIYLRQAILNVVHNAIKFTPAGGAIAVRVSAEGEAGVRIAISDNGPGIAARDAPLVFERFFRASDGAGAGSGAGLGLAIAQWAVRAQGGAIGVGATPGGGCTVWIRFPAAQP